MAKTELKRKETVLKVDENYNPCNDPELQAIEDFFNAFVMGQIIAGVKVMVRLRMATLFPKHASPYKAPYASFMYYAEVGEKTFTILQVEYYHSEHSPFVAIYGKHTVDEEVKCRLNELGLCREKWSSVLQEIPWNKMRYTVWDIKDFDELMQIISIFEPYGRTW